MTISRATLNGDSLQTVTEYEGHLGDSLPESLASLEIEWHDIGDNISLNGWTANASSPSETPVPDEPALPEDGNRIVFTGTVNRYSYDEVIALQGMPDPNGQWADKSQSFRLIVLDTPQTMALMGEESLRSDTVTLISVSYAEGLEQYNGQHLTFSIDPNTTYWPSDTSLPLGQPRTKDIHILN